MKTEANKLLNSLITDETPKKTLDIISFIKKCIKEYPDEKQEECEWQKYFSKIYEIYPRKVNRLNAEKAFEHKIRGYNSEELREKSIKIYKALQKQVQFWKIKGTSKEFIPHFASWLNSNIVNSKHYKGR